MPRAMPGGRRFGTGETELVRLRRDLSDPTLWDAGPTASPQQELAVSDHEIAGSPPAMARERGSHADSRQPFRHPFTHGETTLVWRVCRVPTAGQWRTGRLNGYKYG
ncbi:hypothetical protein J2853_005603 [Streptosporangium lutulentum]|uniref:Uncharacterized protein n=1 Tax=Streptosporangium lutulentum TaxID=1461250 RepID=A0ABT9QI22_9ACTN|nr:hypothetical protein [Streptosporangium lutulentum]